MSRASGTPPARWRRLIRAAAPGPERDAIDGDLLERFQHQVHFQGRPVAAATRDYRRQAVRSVLPLLVSRVDVPATLRFAITIAVATMTFGLVSGLFGEALYHLEVGTSLRLGLHLTLLMPVVALTSLIACRYSATGPRRTAVVYAAVLIAPAVLAPWGGELAALRAAWIAVVPLISVACSGRCDTSIRVIRG